MFPLIKLKALIDEIVRAEGISRRKALGRVLVEQDWQPATAAEIERVHREIRRLD